MRKIRIAAIMEKKKLPLLLWPQAHRQLGKKKKTFKPSHTPMWWRRKQTVEERSFLRKVESQRKGSFAVVMLAVSNMGIRANGQHWHQGNCSLKAEKSEMKAWPCRSLNYVHFMLRLQLRADRCILLSWQWETVQGRSKDTHTPFCEQSQVTRGKNQKSGHR